jgi:hypothetical protein
MCIDDGEVDEHVDCDWACCMLHDEEVRLCNLSCNSRVSGGGWRQWGCSVPVGGTEYGEMGGTCGLECGKSVFSNYLPQDTITSGGYDSCETGQPKLQIYSLGRYGFSFLYFVFNYLQDVQCDEFPATDKRRGSIAGKQLEDVHLILHLSGGVFRHHR